MTTVKSKRKRKVKPVQLYKIVHHVYAGFTTPREQAILLGKKTNNRWKVRGSLDVLAVLKYPTHPDLIAIANTLIGKTVYSYIEDISPICTDTSITEILYDSMFTRELLNEGTKKAT
jgi:hypothetical protein